MIWLLTIAVLGADPVSADYARHDTWAETTLESQEHYAQWWQTQLHGVRLGPWHTTDRGDTFSPDGTADLDTPDAKNIRRWKVRHDLLDGTVHCDLSNHGISEQRRLPGDDVADADQPVNLPTDPQESKGPAHLFQVRRIEVDRPTTVTAWVGAEYGLEVWLDGKCLYRNDRLGNGLYPEPEAAKIELPLAAGTNQLAWKTLGHRWGGFYFSLVPHGQLDPDPIEELLEKLQQDFPVATHQMLADASRELVIAWFRNLGQVDLTERLAGRAAFALEEDCRELQGQLKKTIGARTAEQRQTCLDLYAQAARFRKARTDLELIDFAAMRRAISDLAESFPQEYGQAQPRLRRLKTLEETLPEIDRGLQQSDSAAIGRVAQIVAFQREALLANPLLDFDRLLLVKRRPLGDPRRAKGPNRGMGEFFGLPQQSAWQLDRIRQPYGWENEIAVLSPVHPDGRLTTLYRPPTPRLISDIELHFDARRMMFSMPGSNHLWQIFEIAADGSAARQISDGNHPDVHNFDGCYLPNEKIAFVSTAGMQGVPCSDGINVAMIYLMDGDGRNIRQLCFDQDHDYCPTLTHDGRILYLRWDYTDLPHQWPRILFTMNPDGSGQREYYGSNSYWPNAIFYARPVPGHPTKVAGIVTGHHVGRVGELVIFDPAEGRHEADGVVQRIPGHGKPVEPIIMDKLTMDSWPKFSHPFPLSEKYFIVSCKPTPDALWGLYLVDVFDNLVLLKEVEGEALFEAMPFRPWKRPPVVPERIDLTRDDAVMYMEDVYAGPGLAGVPRGTVKRMRVFTYHFAYQHKTGGQHRVGTDGPWEPKRVLGTVPVEADGSAMFRVPANMPLSMQPLDAEGKAVQLMRSWTTAMPGETVSCVGCHEQQNSTPPSRATIAARKPPAEIEPWHGPLRGFSFHREVQPVLDRYCVACHDGQTQHGGELLVDLRSEQGRFVVFESNNPQPKVIAGAAKEDLVKRYSGVFEPSFFALRRLVRVGGLESDLHVLRPAEFHADTTELFQMLQKGHHGVELDREAWERLATWVDLNAPCHGTWREVLGLERTHHDNMRRLQLRGLYGGIADDPEAVRQPLEPVEPIRPSPPVAVSAEPVEVPGWPFDAVEAQRRQTAAGLLVRRTIDLGDGVTLELVLVPAGQFVMGQIDGSPDERPLAPVLVEKPFWMGRFEVTNGQYARFDPSHDSRHEHGTASFNSERATGPRLNGPRQPVVRVSWQEATAFCRWLSEKMGERCILPDEAQWEYACRAGSADPFWYGDPNVDFSRFANMADATIGRWAYYNERRRSADQVPRDGRFDDGALVTADVGRYEPNVWGLHDMHGNAGEWTRSAYDPYPYRADDGRNRPEADDRRVVRGGSWYDRPPRCRSSFRLSYPPWQKVYNVGFRVVVEAE